jgi:hypothetical protein
LVLYQSKYLKHAFNYQIAEVSWRFTCATWCNWTNFVSRLEFSVHCHICWWPSSYH